MKRLREHRGFTLVELLTVIAIISLLVGVLLPALGHSRGAGQLAVCASNIRQLAIAAPMYAQDYDDRLFPGAPEIQLRNLVRWHGVRNTVGEAFTPTGAPITPYLDDSTSASSAVRACPTFAPTLNALAQRHAGFEQSCGGYGYNNAFAGVERFEITVGVWQQRSDRVGSRIGRFRQPTLTVLFADAAFAGDELIEYSFVEPPMWPQYPTARPDPSTHFRHGGSGSTGRCNVAWLDGHVSAETRTFSSSSGLYPGDPTALGIGWFGDASSNRLFDYE